MSANPFKSVRSVMLTIAVGVWAAGWGNTSAYAQHEHMMHMGHQSSDHSSSPHATSQPGSAKEAAAAPAGPHGGRMTTATPLTFEVVYQPREIRVYLYGPSQKPQTAQKAKGEVVMRVRGNSRTSHAALEYVAPPAGSSEQDYLAAKVDLGGVKDGDMTATFKLENLPLQRPTATFGQPVAIAKANLQVALAAVEQSDQAGIAAQKVCPVTGAKLGSMGDPIKVLVDGKPLYLCCQGCVAKVKNAPETYLSRVSQSHQSP